ncbi:hypothetical protein D0T85_13115 [Bacteroides sp. 519]|nr:hypothetical protein [Bacteroides sp. 519]
MEGVKGSYQELCSLGVIALRYFRASKALTPLTPSEAITPSILYSLHASPKGGIKLKLVTNKLKIKTL